LLCFASDLNKLQGLLCFIIASQMVIFPPSLAVAGTSSSQAYLAAGSGIAVGFLGLGIVGGIVWHTEQQSIMGIRALLGSSKGEGPKQRQGKVD